MTSPKPPVSVDAGTARGSAVLGSSRRPSGRKSRRFTTAVASSRGRQRDARRLLGACSEEAQLEPERPPGIAPDAILRVLRVPPEQAGSRVDVFVHAHLRNTSRTRAQIIVERSAYSLEGRPLRPSDRVRAEDRIALWRPQFEEEVPSVALPLLYEDEHLLAIDKPAPMTVHPTARYYRNTVLKRLEAARPGEFVSLVHRLDRETSGVLLVARSPEADRAFKMMLEDRSLLDSPTSMGRRKPPELRPQVTKAYLAITWGVPDEGIIDLPLESDSDNPLRVKMRIARRGTGLEARTGITVLEQRAGYALLRCELHTGRQHQIRVHLRSVGCPVVGDKLYGPDDRLLARAADGRLDDADLARLELPRHALHAHRYQLAHALTHASLDIVSSLPLDLSAFWTGLATRG
ncbi:MAG: RluA family pseudouridine synthase [Polyangiaceae bacterium]|nr:RluA family pseudouridine synthase [Polyangiaceae bacterium]